MSQPHRHRHRSKDRGVGFRPSQESIDTTIAKGTLVFHMLAALAEFERHLPRERASPPPARGRAGAWPPSMTPDKLEVAHAMLAAGRSEADRCAHDRRQQASDAEGCRSGGEVHAPRPPGSAR